MSVGKYSPTVDVAYMADHDWWEKNGGRAIDADYTVSCYDIDGYDQYGYNIDGVDRAGNSEFDYLSSYIDSIRNGDDEYPSDGTELIYHLAERVYDEWTFKNGKPVPRTK
jgi:hypothetical protein